MIDLSRCKAQRVAVMGLGKSGLAAARALSKGGAQVLAWDDGPASRKAAEQQGFELTDLSMVSFDGLSALVLSPGIPHTHPAPNPVAARAKAAGVPIIGDVELLARAQPKARYVGITGTNGKSTTTSLVAHALKEAGRVVEVGGNLGTPVLTFQPLDENGVYVLEMSSYQLELTPALGFDAACLLNVTPDHLDRHGGMDGYIAAKKRIFQKGTRPHGTHVAVVAIDDDHCRKVADELAADPALRLIRVSAEKAVAGGVGVDDGWLIDATGDAPQTVVDLTLAHSLPGRHNWQNAATAYALCRAMGADPRQIATAILSFPGLAHRQQLLATLDGVRFINDSKATNADAAAKALGCYDDIYWICGGRAKETGINGLELFMDRVRHTFLIGEAAESFSQWLSGKAPWQISNTLSQAVPEAFEMARRNGGGVVLLSPACASFDQFPNFEVRGEVFSGLVRDLVEKEKTGKEA